VEIKVPVNLFIVGAHKAGTTAIYKCLDASNDIFFPVIKEPSYFYLENRSAETIGPFGVDKYSTAQISDIDSYTRLYKKGGRAKYRGDASTIYMYGKVADKIKRYNPNAKIIISLREPVSRAYSAYNYVRMEQLEPLDTFLQAVAAEEKRINLNWGPDWHYLSRGYYYEQVKSFIDEFGRDNVLVLFFEEFVRNQEKMIEPLEDFLGIELPSRAVEKVNDTYIAAGYWDRCFRQFIAAPSGLKSILKNIIPLQLRRKLVEYLLYERTWGRGKRPVKLGDDDLIRIKRAFDADVESLERLLGRDIRGIW